MNTIGIFNQVDEDLDEVLDEVRNVLEYALKKDHLKNVEFNVIIVNNESIQMLNREYRKIDRVTDVITFALEDDKMSVVNYENRMLGDIYISYEKAKEQANEYGHSFLREMCFLAVHGFYHLLGYDHMTEEDEMIMFQKQEEVLSGYGIER